MSIDSIVYGFLNSVTRAALIVAIVLCPEILNAVVWELTWGSVCVTRRLGFPDISPADGPLWIL